MPQIDITPAFRGAITPLELLSSEGTLSFKITTENINRGGIIFNVKDFDFIFTFGIINNNITIKRNSSSIIFPTKKLPYIPKMIEFILIWSFTELKLYILNEKKEYLFLEKETPPTAPPISLIKWAREQSLIPIKIFNDEYEFRQRIYSCINTIQIKVNESGHADIFWDLQYKGKKLVKRIPKKETDIHPFISSILSDQMLLSSIELIPEFKTGVGNLDFLFIGNIKDKGFCKLALEIKNAHSKDIINGLLYQLPKYMENNSAHFGAYCFLWYKGLWFKEPRKYKDFYELLDELQKIQSEQMNPIQEKIRIFGLDLSKTKSASKK